MTKISDLPRELTENILSRVPVTSIRAARSTCKNWNTLTKDPILLETKKKQENEYQVVMMIEYRVSLMSFNLLDPCIERLGKLICLEDADRVDISKIFHCGGLFLCITEDLSSLVVWNPYLGQTRWIKPRNSYYEWDRYALGYSKNNNLRCSHKILRFRNDYDLSVNRRICEYEIFNLDSNSWKVVDDATPDWCIEYYHRGVSLEGNTYWYAHKKLSLNRPRVARDLSDFLLSFNFTTEKFGPHMPLPFHAVFGDTVSLSAVREKQLAVLFQKYGAPARTVKIWISTKIEPNAVSWSKLLLEVDMTPLISSDFNYRAGSFFVDEEKKVAVVIDKERYIHYYNDHYYRYRDVAYIIGNNGYFKKGVLGESRDSWCFPLLCHYVPSTVQI